MNKSIIQEANVLAAISAPSAIDLSLAQTMSGYTVGSLPNVANPQSEPAWTLILDCTLTIPY